MMTNEQISYMAKIYTFVLKERQLRVLDAFHFKSYYNGCWAAEMSNFRSNKNFEFVLFKP